MKTKPTIDVTNIPLMLSTSKVCKLTGLTDEYLHKLHGAGVVTPFQKAKAGYKFWRRDEVLEALGFTPVTNTCPTKQPT
jgi:hypothetical protein